MIGLNIDCSSNTVSVDKMLYVESIPTLLTPLHYIYIFAFFLLPIVIFISNKNRCMSNRAKEPSKTKEGNSVNDKEAAESNQENKVSL